MSFTRIAFFSRVTGPLARRDARENGMTTMTSWDLFGDLRSAQDELLRMTRLPRQFGQFAYQPGTGSPAQPWAPPVDISEREDAYVVVTELPGVATEDLEIKLQDGLLTIQGERHPASGTAGEKVHRSESRYGTFRRSITMPSHVQADKIEALAQDGVLQILVPKAKEMHATRIQVRHGKAKPAVTGKAIKNGA
jgi:HSP20 family protein